MLGSLIIVFREVLEAGLVVGIMLAITKGVRHSGRWIAIGVSTGVLGAALVAGLTSYIGQLFNGSGQEIFNAVILLFAVIMLGWHNIWMSVHGQNMASEARNLGHAVATGEEELKVLALVIALTVLREGSEIVLFLYGIIASDGEKGFSVFLGGEGPPKNLAT